MYENDISIVLFGNYGSWPNSEMKYLLPKVICIKLHVQNFEISCYHSYDILIYTVKKIKISRFQK